MDYYNSVYAHYAGSDNKVFLVCLNILKQQVFSFGDLRPKVDAEDLFGVGVTRLLRFVKERGEGFLAENISLVRSGVRASLIDYLRSELGDINAYRSATDGKKHYSSKYRHRRRSVSLDDCDEIADTRRSADTLYSLLEQERREVIENALEHLKPLDREFARLYYFEDLHEYEIAERFGTAPLIVSRHLAAAREKMQHHLRRYYFCESLR